MSHPPQSVNLFYVSLNHRGLTEHLLKTAISEMNGADYSKIHYLAPTSLKVRESRKIFHKIVKNTYIPPETGTIKQFSKKMFYLYGNKTLISRPLAPIIISKLSGKSLGFSAIISDFIDEIKQYRPDGNIEAVQTELKNISLELNVPEEGLGRAMDAVEIFKKYQNALNEHNLLDENDVLKECHNLIEKHNYSPDVLIIDGFYEITPVERLALKKLIELSKSVAISIPVDNDYADITGSLINFIKDNFMVKENFLTAEKKKAVVSYSSFAGAEEEIENIARRIKNLYISGKYRDLDNIILTFPKLNIYSDIIERVFGRYGIPFAFSRTKPIGRIKPFLDMTALLESIEDGYPRLRFSQFLISPYFKKLPEILRKWIPQASLNSGLIKGKDSWINLIKAVGGLPPDIEKELRRIFKKLAPLESMKENGTYKEFSDALHALIGDFNFSADIEGSDIYKEHLNGILKELSIIDNFIPSETGGVNSSFGLRQFMESLRHILNASETVAEGSGVQVIDFFELRATEPEYLYIGGLKDGDLPSMPEMDHILPDNVRTKLGFVNMKRYLRLQKFIFQRLMDSSKNICLSYPEMEADRLFLPSPFLPRKAEISEKTPGILCREEELRRSGNAPLSSYIKEIVDVKNSLIKKQFGKNSSIRITDIDSYRLCPRKFLIEKILKLEPLEPKEYEVEAKLLGTIIHRIMEILLSKRFANYDQMRANAEDLSNSILDAQPLENYWKNFIRDTFLSILPDIYELETGLMEEGYSFMKAEVIVEGEVMEGVKLRGKIDRVDAKKLSAKEVELVDYKTGAAQLSGTQVIKAGATLQLFLYAALMKLLGFKVNRVGIYSLKDIKITWIPGKNDIREGRTLDYYVTAGLKYLEETLTRARKGDFRALPLNEQICRTCDERPYCPYIQT